MAKKMVAYGSNLKMTESNGIVRCEGNTLISIPAGKLDTTTISATGKTIVSDFVYSTRRNADVILETNNEIMAYENQIAQFEKVVRMAYPDRTEIEYTELLINDARYRRAFEQVKALKEFRRDDTACRKYVYSCDTQDNELYKTFKEVFANAHFELENPTQSDRNAQALCVYRLSSWLASYGLQLTNGFYLKFIATLGKKRANELDIVHGHFTKIGSRNDFFYNLLHLLADTMGMLPIAEDYNRKEAKQAYMDKANDVVASDMYATEKLESGETVARRETRMEKISNERIADANSIEDIE